MLPCICIQGQVIFKTIVPQQTITVGESFPVQYVLEDIEKNDDFIPPVFKGFRLVSGPNIYDGSIYSADGSKFLKNIVFTLVAIKPGRYVLEGATAKINGKFIRSGDVVIQVISKAEAFERSKKEGIDNASEYFLRPGEDPYQKMRKNLFMKVMVNKKNCFVGQPVVATFKLYSRLESRSDIVKNPGFYGFSVQDMINLSDKLLATETIHGKPYDVHTIRKVQLYPLQAGIFTIDAMEVQNKVEFSKSAVNKRTEQEIAEGVFERNDDPGNDNTVSFENNISTEAIPINVKPYPGRNKPEIFNGATGNFSIKATLEKKDLAKNDEGALLVTIEGKGNFTQLSTPVIQWPAGIEGFEPVVKDSLDKTQTPLKGTRTFRFPFVAGKAGRYTLPATSFAFFDPDTNHYKTISAGAIEIRISNAEKKVATKAQQVNIRSEHRSGILWWIGSSLLLIIAIIVTLQFKKRSKEVKTETILPEKAVPAIQIEEILQPAYLALKVDDSQFYTVLQKCIWDFIGARFKLSGSKMNKHHLYKAMHEKQISEDQCQNILDILQQCEASVFTKAEFANGKEELLKRTKRAFEQIRI
jgi:hypothetical protein